jgi:hypothetical protein
MIRPLAERSRWNSRPERWGTEPRAVMRSQPKWGMAETRCACPPIRDAATSLPYGRISCSGRAAAVDHSTLRHPTGLLAAPDRGVPTPCRRGARTASSQVAPQLAAVDALDRDPEDFEHFYEGRRTGRRADPYFLRLRDGLLARHGAQVAVPPSPRMIARSVEGFAAILMLHFIQPGTAVSIWGH